MVAKNKAAAPAPTASDIAAALSKIDVKLFAERTGLPLNQAQRNLVGRTHYVDDSTLKSFGARVHTVHVMDEGLILGMVESLQKGFNKEEGIVFRPVFFDVFGRVVYRPEIAESFATQKAAMGALWAQADEIDAVQETIDGLKEKHEELKRHCEAYKDVLDDLT